MAGFFSRVFDRIFGKENEPPREPPPPVTPGEPPSRGNRYIELWREHVSRRTVRDDKSRTGYSERELVERHLETFLSLPGMAEEDNQARYEYWGDYLDAFISNRRDKKEWLREMGYDMRDYDWQEWRETKGYGHRK